MKKIILTSLFIFLPVNFGIGLLFGVYQTDQPLKIIVSLIISTLFYIVPMYFYSNAKPNNLPFQTTRSANLVSV